MPATSARVVLATLLGALAIAPGARASLTLWPTCTSPPAGDYARCESGAFPQSILPGPDGAMWFTTARADLGRISSTGALEMTKVPAAAGDGLLGGLTVGPDAALWFPSAFGAPYLHRATASSPPAISSVLNPGDTQPRAAALGPDGALWLAEAKSNTLGRLVAPSGPYSSVALPVKPAGTFVGPLTVIAGPDGRLWMPRPKDLVAVSTAGVATAYPTPGVTPTDATVGPDGALWVTGYASDNVLRVTTAGSMTVFPLPAGSAPAGITTGPDGALWIGLGKSASGIMRMTTGGAWTITPILFASQISSVTTGADGAIWFADLGASRIGRLTLPAAPALAALALRPSAGPAGTVVRVTGPGVAGATSVRVGGVAASFTRDAGGLDVTVPPGAGAAPVVVTTPRGRSAPTVAATFSYATAAAPAAPPPSGPALPKVTLGAAAVSGATLTVTVRTTRPAPFDLSSALTVTGRRARIAATTRLRLPRAGTSKGRFTRAGSRRLRLRLTPTARRRIARAGRPGVRLEVGVRLRLGGGQTTVGQRTYRVRKG